MNVATIKERISPIASLGSAVRKPRPVLVIDPSTDFSSMEIVLQPNYYDGFTSRRLSYRQVTVGRYLKSNDAAYSHLMCVETPIPSAVASKLRLTVSKIGSDRAAVCLFHAGRAGSIAPLHYDWDHKWVLHACLTGKKKFYFFPPEAGWLLNPIVNTSAICVPRLSRIDRTDLLHRLDGLEVDLAAGQAVLFPSMWWHAVQYEAPSMSVSVRFGERPALRPFAALPRSFWLQRLVWKFFRDNQRSNSRFLIQCLSAFFRDCSWSERYRSVNAVYRAALQELSQSYGAEYLTSDNFNSELHLASQELKDLYSLNGGDRSSKFSSESLADAGAYLFGGTSAVPYKMQQALAEFALAKRQGLEPRRGLIAVQRK